MLTARQLNRATLDRQLLLRRERLPVDDAMGRIVALQAQEPPSPYIALWSRVDGFDPADLDTAFADATVVKATLMRITLHAVRAEDYPVFHAAMVATLRASRLHDRRYTTTGLTVADADAYLPAVLAFAAETPRTRPEMEAMLREAAGDRAKELWWAYRTFAPFHHRPTGGPWSFGTKASYAAAPGTLAADARDDAVRRLARRYLEGFGPASPADFARFTMLARSAARDAFRGLGDELVRLEGPAGEELYDVTGSNLPDEDVATPPRLLPMWDSTLLAYADRSRLILPEYRPLVTRVNGDVLPTLLVDGYVAGVWRPVDGGIEASAFHRLPEETWAGLAEEARALTTFLAGRDPLPYRRYGHWWGRLPAGETRLLER